MRGNISRIEFCCILGSMGQLHATLLCLMLLQSITLSWKPSRRWVQAWGAEERAGHVRGHEDRAVWGPQSPGRGSLVGFRETCRAHKTCLGPRFEVWGDSLWSSEQIWQFLGPDGEENKIRFVKLSPGLPILGPHVIIYVLPKWHVLVQNISIFKNLKWLCWSRRRN